MLISLPERTARRSLLARSVFAQMRAKVTHTDVETVAKKMRSGDDVMKVINKADAVVGTTTGSHWADDLVQTVYGEYLSWLAPGSAAARLFPLGLSIPMRGGTFNAPGRDTAPVALPWIGEALPLPVREMAFMNVSLTPKKMGAISIMTRELAKTGGEETVTTLLREDGERGLDAGYFSTATGDATTHAGLLAGLTAIDGYSGGDEVAFSNDIGALLAVVAPSGSDRIVLIASQYTALKIATKFPHFRLPVFPSQAVADTRLIAVDAGALIHSFGGFEVDISYDAAVHLSNVPLEIVSGTGPTTADPVTSLYQVDAMGIRIMGLVAFAARKASAVAYVDNMSW